MSEFPHPAQGPEPQYFSPCPSKATAGLVSSSPLLYPAQPWLLLHHTDPWDHILVLPWPSPGPTARPSNCRTWSWPWPVYRLPGLTQISLIITTLPYGVDSWLGLATTSGPVQFPVSSAVGQTEEQDLFWGDIQNVWNWFPLLGRS